MKLIGLFLAINFIYYALNFLSVLASSVDIQSTGLIGKGFLINYKNNSYILTNAHVCEGLSNNIEVSSIFETEYIRNIKFKNFKSDLCVITNETNLSYYPFKSFQTIKFSAVSKKNSFATIIRSEELKFKHGKDILKERKSFASIQFPNKEIELDVVRSTHPINQGDSGSPIFDYNMRFKGIVVGNFYSLDSDTTGGYYLDSKQIIKDLDTL